MTKKYTSYEVNTQLKKSDQLIKLILSLTRAMMNRIKKEKKSLLSLKRSLNLYERIYPKDESRDISLEILRCETRLKVLNKHYEGLILINNVSEGRMPALVQKISTPKCGNPDFQSNKQ